MGGIVSLSTLHHSHGAKRGVRFNDDSHLQGWAADSQSRQKGAEQAMPLLYRSLGSAEALNYSSSSALNYSLASSARPQRASDKEHYARPQHVSEKEHYARFFSEHNAGHRPPAASDTQPQYAPPARHAVLPELPPRVHVEIAANRTAVAYLSWDPAPARPKVSEAGLYEVQAIGGRDATWRTAWVGSLTECTLAGLLQVMSLE